MLIAHQSFIIFQTLLHIKEVLKDDTSLHQNLWEYLELKTKKSCTIGWILYEQKEFHYKQTKQKFLRQNFFYVIK